MKNVDHDISIYKFNIKALRAIYFTKPVEDVIIVTASGVPLLCSKNKGWSILEPVQKPKLEFSIFNLLNFLPCPSCIFTSHLCDLTGLYFLLPSVQYILIYLRS